MTLIFYLVAYNLLNYQLLIFFEGFKDGKENGTNVEGKRQRKPAAPPALTPETIGKKHALEIYDQFTLNTSCFWEISGSNITPIVQFHGIFVSK